MEAFGYVALRFDFRSCGESEGERAQVRCFDQEAAAQASQMGFELGLNAGDGEDVLPRQQVHRQRLVAARTVGAANTAAEALTILDRWRPHVVLLDTMGAPGLNDVGIYDGRRLVERTRAGGSRDRLRLTREGFVLSTSVIGDPFAGRIAADGQEP